MIGNFFESNHKRFLHLSDNDWKVALSKCKTHIRWRLKQRTLFGAHSPSNLGADPIDHYLGIAYEKILSGEWEWKEEFTLSQQMIRIANKFISDEVEKFKSPKGQALQISYHDIEEEFYNLANAPPIDDNFENQKKLQIIKDATAGDDQLIFLIESLVEGLKRREIAELLEITPKQFDKLKEKLERRVKNYKPSH